LSPLSVAAAMFFKQSLLALLAVQVFGAIAQDAEPGFTPNDGAPVLNADIVTTFADSDILGVKLVNGRPTKAVVEIENNEAGPIQVMFLAGTLSTTKELPEDAPSYQSVLHNLTAAQYNIEIEAGEKKELPYSFALDMQPQDVRVLLMAVVTNAKGNIFQVEAFNGTASIVEPPVSFFDPQMCVPDPYHSGWHLSAASLKSFQSRQTVSVLLT
jgi:hypothetical protein